MSKANNIILLFIIGIGLCLRLYRIDAQLFWVDELGVGKAAMMPTLSDALKSAQNHVMAMPLDYVVAWFMGRFSVDEGWLRLPEVIWGTLTLVAGYLLYRQVLEKRTALLATFLLAISPVLIEYSQELRFYAPLVFFYTLTAAVGLEAGRAGKAINWLGFSVLCLAGVLFHIYAMLVLIPVSLWTLGEKNARQRNLRLFPVSVLFVLLGTEMALFIYGSFPGESSSLFAFEPPWRVILGGFGWLPTYPATVPAFLFGIFNLLLALVGIHHLSFSSHRKLVWFMLISIILQISVLLGAIALKHYFASARQFIMLVPFAALLSAAGMDSLIRKAQNYFSKTDFQAGLIYGMAILALCSAALPALQQYYDIEKGSTRPILHLLDREWRSGQVIYIAPGYHRDVYKYYANRLENNPELALSFTPLVIAAGQTVPDQTAYLISEPSFDGTHLGFDLIFTPPANTLYPNVLWKKP